MTSIGKDVIIANRPVNPADPFNKARTEYIVGYYFSGNCHTSISVFGINEEEAIKFAKEDLANHYNPKGIEWHLDNDGARKVLPFVGFIH